MGFIGEIGTFAGDLYRFIRYYSRRRSARPSYRGGFHASDTGRLFSSWTSTPVPVDAYIKAELPKLRARSRDRARNDVYASRFLNMVTNHVVGPSGVVFQSRAMNPNGEPDNLAIKAIENEFKKWGESCDVTGRLNWVDTQRLFMSTVASDGEAIGRKVRGQEHNQYSFAIQLIDPELLDVAYSEEWTAKRGSEIRMGIEFNTWGRPIAYHFIDTKNNANSYYASRTGKKYIRIPAEEIIHGFLLEHIGQSRGIPFMVTALARMQMLDAYEESAIINARAGASNMGFFTSPDGAGFKGDDKLATGELVLEADPGVFRQLPDGMGFQAYNPEYPNGEYPHFIKQQLRGCAAGLNVSYAALAGDLESVNYSSIRAGVLEERDVWRGLQDWFIRIFMKPVYAGWLSQALLNEQITVLGSPLKITNYEKYLNATFQPRRWQWVDPLKDLKATVLAVQNGIMTPSEAIRERGRDPDDIWLEYASDIEKLKKIGIDPTTERPKDGTEKENEGGPVEND